ncbi:hypothetical protein [Halorubrum distributum]|nr:hypothetical protein [Halorubrum distributum]
MNIDDLNFIDEFSEILSAAGVDRSEVCLTGSAPLAVYGIRENGDLDFVATPAARKKIEALAKRRSDCRVDDDGHMVLSGNIDLSRPDRYDVVGFDDSELIHGDLHVTVDGYKVIRLEVALGFKAAIRRPKDIDDIELITDSGYVGSEDWSWEYVRLVPIWERPSNSNGAALVSLFKQGINLLREEGGSMTFVKTIKFLIRRLPMEPLSHTKYMIGAAFSRLGELNRNVRDDTKHTIGATFSQESFRALPAILNDQFTQAGMFERNDLVVSVLAQEGTELADPKRLLTEAETETVHLSESGKILAGVQQLADLIVEYGDRLPGEATSLDVPIERSRGEPLQPRTDEWVSETFDDTGSAVITQRREQLLKECGTAFYLFLWPAAQEYFDEIERLARDRGSVIDSTDYRLDGKLAKIIRDIYSVDKRNEKWVRDKKIHELQKYEPRIRVLSFRLPDPDFQKKSAERLSRRTYDLKLDLRKEIQQIHPEYTYATCVHVTDNFAHNSHISELLSKLDTYRVETTQTEPNDTKQTD